MSKWKPMVERVEASAWPIIIEDPDCGETISLTWAQAARLVGELQQELQDYEVELQAQRELEVRAAEMLEVTATTSIDEKAGQAISKAWDSPLNPTGAPR